MFRIIHPNRWFFWTIAILLGISLFVLWSIEEANQEFLDAPIASDTNIWRTWRSEALGISVSYPAGWQIEIDRDDAQNVFLENSQNYKENISITVRKPSLESAIRESISIVSESTVMVDDEQGSWLKGDAEDDQATSNVILVEHDEKLYYIAGSARVFKKIIDSVRFID